MKLRLVLFPLLLTCMQMQAAAAVELSRERQIFAPDRSDILLHQCSRDVPSYDGKWQPSAEDVAQFETVLTAEGASILKHAGLKSDDFSKLSRSYGGFTRKGRRYIYGDFGPEPGMMICDGGPRFFGVEFDVEARAITHEAHNGVT